MSAAAATAPGCAATIDDAVRCGAARLAACGIASARLDAELLLAGALGVDRARLRIDCARGVSEEARARYEAALRRREAREPLQRIRGTQEFYSRDFDVRADVLIPRPETEILVEAALALVARARSPRIVDLGTGSGAIAITLALELPGARVVAIDTSEAAVALARENARRHGVEERVDVRRGDWTEPCGDDRFDLVVSNPPYVRRHEIAALEPEVRDFEPRAALDGGVDGLDAYRRLAARVAAVLDPAGAVVLEIGQGQGDTVGELFADEGFTLRGARADLAGIERVLVFSRTEDGRG